MFISFSGDQIFMDFAGFLIHDVLWGFVYMLRYNICSACFLDTY